MPEVERNVWKLRRSKVENLGPMSEGAASMEAMGHFFVPSGFTKDSRERHLKSLQINTREVLR